MTTTKERAKYRNLSRDSRIAVCIFSEPRGEDYVTLRGRAEIIDDESLWPETQAIVERYEAPERLEARMQALRAQDRVIISMVPDRVIFRPPRLP